MKTKTKTLRSELLRKTDNNNLLGDSRFCPMIRRTEKLRGFEGADLLGACRKVVSAYPVSFERLRAIMLPRPDNPNLITVR